MDNHSTPLRFPNLSNRLGPTGIPLGTLDVNKQTVIRLLMCERETVTMEWKVDWIL